MHDLYGTGGAFGIACGVVGSVFGMLGGGGCGGPMMVPAGYPAPGLLGPMVPGPPVPPGPMMMQQPSVLGGLIGKRSAAGT